MPPPSVWGPPLWNILHGIGPLSGRIPSLRKDSERECIWLLTHLEYIIPCKECIDHLIQFKRKNPIPKSYTTIGEWVCSLHNSVNEKLGKEIIAYGDFQPTESKASWDMYLDTIKDSILLGLVTGDRLREFSRHMRLWMQYSI
jgi:hypothetical protein